MKKVLLILFLMLCAESALAQKVSLDCVINRERQYPLDLDLDKGWATIGTLTNSMFTVYSEDPTYRLHIHPEYIFFGRDDNQTSIRLFLERKTLKLEGLMFGDIARGECSLVKRDLSSNKF